MNPKKLGGMANHKQEPWKMPLPQFIEHRYQRQFGKKMPEDVRSIEKKVAEKRARKEMKKNSNQVALDDSAKEASQPSPIRDIAAYPVRSGFTRKGRNSK